VLTRERGVGTDFVYAWTIKIAGISAAWLVDLAALHHLGMLIASSSACRAQTPTPTIRTVCALI